MAAPYPPLLEPGDPVSPDMIGSRYTVQAHIRSDVISHDYRCARISVPDETVIAKVLHAHQADLDDARYTMRLNASPAILDYLDIITRADLDHGGFEHQRPYVITEDRPNTQTLAQFLMVNGTQRLDDPLLDGLRRLAEAIDFAHRQGIVHGTINTGTIRIDEGYMTWLTGFALSRQRIARLMGTLGSEAHTLPDVNTPLGDALASLPPELVLGDVEEPIAVSDVFALAAVVFETVSGERPFDYIQGYSGQRRSISQMVEGFGSQVDAVFAQALSLDLAERFGSATAFIDALAGATDRYRSATAVDVEMLEQVYQRHMDNMRFHKAYATLETLEAARGVTDPDQRPMLEDTLMPWEDRLNEAQAAKSGYQFEDAIDLLDEADAIYDDPAARSRVDSVRQSVRASWRDAARRLVRQRSYGAGRDMLDTYLARFPDDEDALDIRAEADKGQAFSARKTEFDRDYQRAEDAFLKGDYEMAVAILGPLLESYPDIYEEKTRSLSRDLLQQAADQVYEQAQRRAQEGIHESVVRRLALLYRFVPGFDDPQGLASQAATGLYHEIAPLSINDDNRAAAAEAVNNLLALYPQQTEFQQLKERIDPQGAYDPADTMHIPASALTETRPMSKAQPGLNETLIESPFAETQQGQPLSEDPEPRDRRSGLAIGGIVTLLLVLLLGAGFFVFGDGLPGASPEPTEIQPSATVTDLPPSPTATDPPPTDTPTPAAVAAEPTAEPPTDVPPTDTPTATPTPAPGEIGSQIELAENATLFEGPFQTEGGALDFLSQGQKVKLLGRAAPNYGSWLFVESPDGRTQGYIDRGLTIWSPTWDWDILPVITFAGGSTGSGSTGSTATPTLSATADDDDVTATDSDLTAAPTDEDITPDATSDGTEEATVTPTSPPSEPLVLESLYPVEYNCLEGGGWSAYLYMRVRGGTGVYSFYVEGQLYSGPTTQPDYSHFVTGNKDSPRILRVRIVDSGGSVVENDGAYIAPADCGG